MQRWACTSVVFWVMAGCSDDGTVSADTDAGTAASNDTEDDTVPGAEGGGGVGGSEASSDPTDAEDDATTATATATDGSDDPGNGGSTSGGPAPMPEGIYVSIDSGADSNPGTPEEPVRTIAQGTTLAVEAGVGFVYIAAGTYEMNSDDSDVVEVVEGISLRGGFAADDWTQWDPQAHVSQLVDTGSAAAGFNPQNPHRALLVPADVTAETVVEGLTLQAAAVANAAGAVIEGDATLRGNVLLGGGELFSTGLFLRESGARVEFNRIDGVAAPPDQPAFGIRASGGAPVVVGNEIHSGEGFNNRAVLLSAAAGTVASNVIVAEAGSGGGGRAVELSESTTAVVSNTMVVAGDMVGFHVIAAGASGPSALDNNNFISLATTAWCYASADGQDVGSMRNNNLGCSNLYNGQAVYTSIAGLESGLATASDNVAEPSGVAEPTEDGHLADDGSVLCSVARGGLELEDEAAAVDLDREDRTAPWSIGADELDGDCL